MKILVISNGHGEDIIATSIIKELIILPEVSQIAALPLVGEGYAYKKIRVPIISKVKNMPSGGFNRKISELYRDVNHGLINLLYHQYKTIAQWGKDGGNILAIGDIVPLLFAWLSQTKFAFIGVAKSEYYIKNENGWLPSTPIFRRCFQSIYYPWERWLMNSSLCRGVFVRDSLTATTLQKLKISAYNLGNPMMNDFVNLKETYFNPHLNKIIFLLLPGSRIPEAQHNWQLILEAIKIILEVFSTKSLLFLGAIAPNLNLKIFQEKLINNTWTSQVLNKDHIKLKDPQALQFEKEGATLILTQLAYRECLQSAHIAIAMAGTATEQFVGLGKPVITFPGDGPQFTRQFAKNQSYLLGPSIILIETPQQINSALTKLLDNNNPVNNFYENGKRRMGNSGASRRIARYLINQCFNVFD